MTEIASHRIVLPNPPIKQAKLYINGRWKSASDGKTCPTISPITETAIANAFFGIFYNKGEIGISLIY
jgi:aldehyde dehydrogenase (NAD+)